MNPFYCKLYSTDNGYSTNLQQPQTTDGNGKGLNHVATFNRVTFHRNPKGAWSLVKCHFMAKHGVIWENVAVPDELRNFWTTQILIDSLSVLLIYVSKNTQVFDFTNSHFDPGHLSSQPMLLLSLSSNPLLSVSLSLLSALFPSVFYLSPFHINTRCFDERISLNKLDWT
jgi:hypothetical protein